MMEEPEILEEEPEIIEEPGPTEKASEPEEISKRDVADTQTAKDESMAGAKDEEDSKTEQYFEKHGFKGLKAKAGDRCGPDGRFVIQEKIGAGSFSTVFR